MGCLDQARFAVLFEDETVGEIHDQLVTITAAVEQEVLASFDASHQMGAYFGFALYPRQVSTARELWTMASRALAARTSEASMRSSEMKTA